MPNVDYRLCMIRDLGKFLVEKQEKMHCIVWFIEIHDLKNAGEQNMEFLFRGWTFMPSLLMQFLAADIGIKILSYLSLNKCHAYSQSSEIRKTSLMNSVDIAMIFETDVEKHFL